MHDVAVGGVDHVCGEVRLEGSPTRILMRLALFENLLTIGAVAKARYRHRNGHSARSPRGTEWRVAGPIRPRVSGTTAYATLTGNDTTLLAMA